MSTTKTINIDPISAISLILEVQVNGLSLATGTGFIVQQKGQNYLITNWHMVSGRNADTGECLSATGGLPDSIVIAYHLKDKIGSWVMLRHPLYKDESPKWIQHPKHTEQNRIDVVALPLGNLPDKIAVYPLDLSLADTDMVPSPGMPVSIIGFPLGKTSAGAFPIWKTGHIASDPDLDYQGLPIFLIDATTRSGMSGAPVILRSNGFTSKTGQFAMSTGFRTLFLGVYSGRIHNDIEVGRVWKPIIIMDLFQ